MHIKNLKSRTFISLALLTAMITTGCRMVTDGLDACPAQLRVKFVCYDLKGGDVFANEVSSVNVWAFNPGGALVWSGSASGPQLATGDFFLETPLPEGTYDFVTWCGLEGNTDFDLATYTPASKEELELTMKTLETEGDYTSDKRLIPVYHGEKMNVDYKVNPYEPTYEMVMASLTKDTKDIRVMLQHLDGSEIENRDFTVSITVANAEYAWNNALLSSPPVNYLPWNIRYGAMTKPGKENGSSAGDGGTVTTVSTLLFELSTGRLMVDSNAVLTIHRNWDDREIVRIPLVNYLLLIKGHYGNLTDQEYLDRQDDYSLVFFIDPNNNWYDAGIFINGWAVVPPQDQDF